MDRVAPATAVRRLRTPRAAGIAGIAFALLLGTVLVLLKLAVPSDPSQAGTLLTDPHRRRLVAVALNLVPYAGIAFLWFLGVVRDRIGAHEDRFFATLFLGSGLLFVAMLFVGAAIAGGLIADASFRAGRLSQPAVWGFGQRLTAQLVNIYALRMASVFALSATNIMLRTSVFPRWLGYLGIVVALVMLISSGLSAWVSLLFPIWILIVSVHILVTTFAATAVGDDSREARS